MNTKIPLLVLVFALLIPTSIVAVKSVKKSATQISTMSASPKATISFLKFVNIENEWPHSWAKSGLQKKSESQPEEDGKWHRFHFTRIKRGRLRAFLRFVSKLMLVVLHLATLLFGYFHILH